MARAGQHLRRVWPAFDRARFESLATTGLETLDLKARAMRLELGDIPPGEFPLRRITLDRGQLAQVSINAIDQELSLNNFNGQLTAFDWQAGSQPSGYLAGTLGDMGRGLFQLEAVEGKLADDGVAVEQVRSNLPARGEQAQGDGVAAKDKPAQTAACLCRLSGGMPLQVGIGNRHHAGGRVRLQGRRADSLTLPAAAGRGRSAVLGPARGRRTSHSAAGWRCAGVVAPPPAGLDHRPFAIIPPLVPKVLQGAVMNLTTLLSAAAALAVLAVALAAAGAARAEPAVIFDMGGKFDKSFNQSGYDGAERWKKETGKPYLEFEISNPAQREQALRRMAERGADPIIGIGFSQGSAIDKVSRDFPKLKFVVIDAEAMLDRHRN